MTQTDITNELKKYSRSWKSLSQSMPHDRKSSRLILAACRDLDTLIARIETESTEEGETP